MMKVLLILPRFDRQKWDSLTDQAWHTAKLMAADGQAQCFIAAGRTESEKAMEVVCNVPIHRFMPEQPRWKFLRRFHKVDLLSGNSELPGLELFLRKNQFDLVHIFCKGHLCEWVSQLLTELKTPYVVSCRSEDFRISDAASGKRDDSHGMFRKVFREYGSALSHAQRVFCGDHALRRLLAVELGDRPLVYWLPGVDLERFSKPSAVDFRQFYQIPPSRKIILSVGNISESKNQQLLLETVSVLNNRNRNCQLVLIGWCDSEEFMVKLRILIEERNLKDAITLIPGLPPGDECFRAAFQAASLLLLPSRYDVSASAVLEAWASGVPVIASPVGGGGDLIEDNCNGKLANPRNFQDFVRSCEFLLDERNRRELEKMRSDGMVRARSLRWERRLEDLMEIYKQILDK